LVPDDATARRGRISPPAADDQQRNRRTQHGEAGLGHEGDLQCLSQDACGLAGEPGRPAERLRALAELRSPDAPSFSPPPPHKTRPDAALPGQ
jgi:hypothetical protein